MLNIVTIIHSCEENTNYWPVLRCLLCRSERIDSDYLISMILQLSCRCFIFTRMNPILLKDILKKYDLKVTPVRLSVLDVLVNSDVALSHADITEHLGDSSIDKVTLYRTLNSFHEKGLIHKVATEDRNWLYAIMLEDTVDPVSDHDHAHFICDICEKIFCFPVSEQTQSGILGIKEGFQVKQQEIRLHGLCPSCH